ncbi:hypothetical protein ACJMK2_036292 [Sinanodonta woodiana]|uniref:S1 motif domain-containing protein n=1 Tax=Sinanodonta woodiana TaxID=1069815 RepID=A0ABD3WIV5_SINWO
MAKSKKSAEIETEWTVPRVISVRIEVPEWVTKNVVQLLDEGCTIPFIARYRKEQTGGMEVSKIRAVSDLLEELRGVQSKINSVKFTIENMGKLTDALLSALRNAQTMTEVEDLYAPFKPGNKGSLAERARALGLEPLALQYLEASPYINPEQYINQEEKGLSTLAKIELGVQHILADKIHKEKEMMDLIRELAESADIKLESHQTSKSAGKEKDTEKSKNKNFKQNDSQKYQNYFDFSLPLRSVKPHQVLAINRGEENKVLAVNVNLPNRISWKITEHAKKKWMKPQMTDHVRSVVQKSIDDAKDRLILPQIIRLVRSNLTKTAEKASIDVFAANLKNLLLTPSVKGLTILAMDPGFKNGCKIAVISPTGQILHTDVVYILSSNAIAQQEKSKLMSAIFKFRCDVFAVGNGVACRETEAYVSDLIKKDKLNMKYCIIDESGASIYSVSDEAEKELPGMDPSLRGAVSIGRRLLDPLAELVKIEPKHIGVGQYQHDMPQAQLKKALDSTVEECVSFVGVDINTCSKHLLRRVAGLSDKKAQKILEMREKSGPFTCRQQLMSVTGLGGKSFEQCAGFIRVHKLVANFEHVHQSQEDQGDEEVKIDLGEQQKGRKRKAATTKSTAKKRKLVSLEPNPLDMTWIHPESYELTYKLLDKMNLSLTDLGHTMFVDTVKQYLRNTSFKALSEELESGTHTLKLIFDALVRPLTFDYREGFEKPLFRSSLSSMDELKTGKHLTGKVTNVTHFGAFVDIGVGTNGLIHTSQMRLNSSSAKQSVELGDKVEVEVISMDSARNRIGLRLVHFL